MGTTAMIKPPCWARASSLAAALAVLILVPDACAKGHPRMAPHGGGGGHHSAPRQTYRAPKMPKMPSTANKAPKTPRTNTANTARPRNLSASSTTGAATSRNTGRLGSATTASHYYGTNRSYGRGRMPYRRYGSGYGYGRRYGSNRYNGAIVSRLRSAHSTLARADHDYRGHRVQAMRSIRSAIRQLSHSSSRYGMSGMNGQALGMRGVANRANLAGAGNRGNLAGRGNRGGGRMPQAQSDALMRRAQSTLQLVSSHMANQGGSGRTGRAYGYVNRAMQHINTGLSIR